ncbi:unnamed protein product [Rotaria sordida]|uniref:Uncharacterized protein n=1 Tax=Rotaria sordida TaxID=392033 RepID=A0A815SI06_9BILA|nr:unnamed protein product [Rotaria sordida]CAF1150174.1 unnamed protein product [Rotaria sordida]CAF1213004.1 unnamed protein product [Rotaria sordida]CAF1215647.1 unnamed protein product [Rotaria sordida]CAF1490928.1 unnamed protein product [Rotaria sordida]
MPSVEGDDHDYNINNGEKMIFYYDIGDKNYSYDDDNNYGWNDDQQQQQIELSENDVDGIDQGWVMLNDINSEWIDVDDIDHEWFDVINDVNNE